MPSTISGSVLKEVGRRAVPLHDADSLAGLIEHISQARVVMLGESSHGTHDFYQWRSLISQQLIAHHGFHFVAVEGDWPSAQTINRELLNYPHKEKKPSSVREVLVKAFTRWPTWMWANQETEAFIKWLQAFNAQKKGVSSRNSVSKPVRFYGLDLYSLFESIDVVLRELQKIDPALAARAKKHYACFNPYEKSEEEYMQSLLECPEGCKAQVLKVLQEVRRSNMQGRRRGEDKEDQDEDDDDGIALDMKQNAKIAVDAENYYRKVMFGRGSESWNVRDKHMLATLDVLLGYYGGGAGKGIVWAHNTHIGDYRATSMAKEGSVNIGGLAREKYGEDAVALVGFGTHRGTVIAAPAWAAPMERMNVPPAKEGSYEDLLHKAIPFVPKDVGNSSRPLNEFYFCLRKNKQVSTMESAAYSKDDDEDIMEEGVLQEWRGNRAIGVVYDPWVERWGNYVPTRLAKRYNGFVFVDESTAVQPLVGFDQPVDPKGELPESWPFGV